MEHIRSGSNGDGDGLGEARGRKHLDPFKNGHQYRLGGLELCGEEKGEKRPSGCSEKTMMPTSGCHWSSSWSCAFRSYLEGACSGAGLQLSMAGFCKGPGMSLHSKHSMGACQPATMPCTCPAKSRATPDQTSVPCWTSASGTNVKIDLLHTVHHIRCTAPSSTGYSLPRAKDRRVPVAWVAPVPSVCGTCYRGTITAGPVTVALCPSSPKTRLPARHQTTWPTIHSTPHFLFNHTVTCRKRESARPLERGCLVPPRRCGPPLDHPSAIRPGRAARHRSR